MGSLSQRSRSLTKNKKKKFPYRVFHLGIYITHVEISSGVGLHVYSIIEAKATVTFTKLVVGGVNNIVF
jgi:hypothetical protein